MAVDSGEDTGPNPTDRGKSGWKWSVGADRAGIPVGWTIAGANRSDSIQLEPTLDAIAANGLLVDIETIHLDRGYDSHVTRNASPQPGSPTRSSNDAEQRPPGVKKQPMNLGLRWVVEATNSWWSNYGQLRRNTDRRTRHRHAALCLATTILIVGRLIDHRDRWPT